MELQFSFRLKRSLHTIFAFRLLFVVAWDRFKLSFKHFSTAINLRAKSSWIAIKTAAFLSLFDIVPES
jgi:hypothetical protein